MSSEAALKKARCEFSSLLIIEASSPMQNDLLKAVAQSALQMQHDMLQISLKTSRPRLLIPWMLP